MAENFNDERNATVSTYKSSPSLQAAATTFLNESVIARYSYNFDWLGRPIIQYPQDIVAVQEIIWAVKPDLVIETGIAHGGSIVFTASQLALLDYCDAIATGEMLDPKLPKRRVLAIDIDIRSHNRHEIEKHPMFNRIDLIEGSSISASTVAKVREFSKPYKTVLVMLDSNHTHDHVLSELGAYAPLVSAGSYCIVFDTVIEDLPDSLFADRPWGIGNNAKTAVFEYLKILDDGATLANDGNVLNLKVENGIEDKLLLSAAPSGYLKRI